jgi:pimeloyl-ACP methyl ester carboxylesterase
MVHYRTATVDGGRVFHREAGEPTHPTLLSLHGFPSSSERRPGLEERSY